MEIIELFEHGLTEIVSLVKLILEAISVLCVIVGLLATGRRIILQPSLLHAVPFFQLRLCFGSWLALALEFQLGADILATTIAPSFQALGRLGAIAIIRTFLNYFLNHELENERQFQQPKNQG